MKKEDADKIKCDRCGAVTSLFQHDYGWRCPQCIWNEREIMLEALSACDCYFTYLGQGTGEEMAHELTKAALLLRTHKCTECLGHGKVIIDRGRGYIDRCKTCDGKGVERE